MRILCIAVAATMLAGSAATTFGQCEDPFDAVLCVHHVAVADEQFEMDGRVSDFWSNWESKDYVELIPPGDCYPVTCGFDDAEDATLSIKAVGTSKGLYMLASVKDNTWVDRADIDDWGADAVDFYFDKLSANDIWTCTDCLIGLYDAVFSYSTQQFQVWMGATGLPAGCRYAYYDDQLWSWQTIELTWDEAKNQYGYEIDVIQGDDPGIKQQEWFFPWQTYAKGIEVGTLLDGKRLAFSGGYNDKDGDNADPHCLRWQTKDPWQNDANYWGDLLLADGMGTVEAVMDVKGAQAASVRAKPRAAVVSTEYFTLRGRRIARDALRSLPRGSMIMRRHRLADGTMVSEMHRVIR